MTLLAKQNEHDNCSTSIDKLNLYNESDLSLIESYLNRMIKSDKGGIKTIAEGVEESNQMEILRALECDEIQGYLLGRPVPNHIFEAEHLDKML